MQIQPAILRLAPEKANMLFLKLRPGTIQMAVREIQEICHTLSPNYPQEVLFLEEFCYGIEEVGEIVNTLLLAFTILAIFIASLGLFGLSGFMTGQRTKEIGVRKVLGASVAGILRLLFKELSWLLLIANLIAWSLACFLTNGLLSNFATRIQVGIGFFVFAGAVTLLVAILSVSWQALRAATTNPVEALRYEQKQCLNCLK